MKRAWELILAAVMVLPVWLVGCGDGAEGGWQGIVRDSAGVQMVENTGRGLWAPGEAWTVDTELLIGTAEGEAEYQFGQIAGLDVDADGRIYVLDQQASEVRVFDPDGQFIRSMGRAGSGPGELSQGAGPVFVAPGGDVLVPDIMNQRINLYSPLGEATGSTPLVMTDGIPIRWLKASNHDLVQQSMVMALPGMDAEPKNLLLRRDPQGMVLDTLLVLPVGESVDLSAGPRLKVFATEAVWALAWDDRLIHGQNDEYRLRLLAADGALERIVDQQTERRPVTAGDQTAFRSLFRKMFEEQGVPPEGLDMLLQGMSFADYYPAYANLLGGPDGTIWVQGVQTPETVEEAGATFEIQDMGAPVWDVFDAEGRLLGAVRMPDRFTPMFFDRDHLYALYGIQRDELDVQYVARVRVGPPLLPE